MQASSVVSSNSSLKFPCRGHERAAGDAPSRGGKRGRRRRGTRSRRRPAPKTRKTSGLGGPPQGGGLRGGGGPGRSRTGALLQPAPLGTRSYLLSRDLPARRGVEGTSCWQNRSPSKRSFAHTRRFLRVGPWPATLGGAPPASTAWHSVLPALAETYRPTSVGVRSDLFYEEHRAREGRNHDASLGHSTAWALARQGRWPGPNRQQASRRGSPPSRLDLEPSFFRSRAGTAIAPPLSGRSSSGPLNRPPLTSSGHSGLHPRARPVGP